LALRASFHLITSEAFEAAKSGDVKNWAPCDDQTTVELDIFWHAIHFLLTGDTSLTFLQSGVQIPQVSDHCEVHSPQDVIALDARLSKTTVSELMSTFDSAKFDGLGIYGGRWAIRTDVSEPYTFKAAEEWDKYQRGHIEELLVRFIAFVKHAAENNLGILVAIL
jgi:hypothetical protein